MYDGGKIVPGIVVFFGIAVFPFLYNVGQGKAQKPDPKIDTPVIKQKMQETGKKQCVEPKAFMRGEHMQMLNNWRDAVIRDGDRTYVSSTGERYVMSLQNTCMNCHSNKKEFCDSCHNYAAVKPYCFNCHLEPKEAAKVAENESH